jgi:leucyl aminopeptidase
MSFNLIEGSENAVPVTVLADADAIAEWLAGQSENIANWVKATGFSAKPGSICLISDEKGHLERALTGIDSQNADLWAWAALRMALPDGVFQLDSTLNEKEATRAALGWALAGYRFDRYLKKQEEPGSFLVWPESCERDAVIFSAQATFLTRDLVNTPASDMGPEQLAQAALALAQSHTADCQIIVGEDLLKGNFPGIHAVGRASVNEPRLIDLHWGDASNPKLTLIGKGVCFDSGGLDLKPASGMKLMKKDMGGAANVLGLALMIMAAGLPVRLRVLIPAVENSVSGNAMRPLDVITMRGGQTVEIGNTDAEGRVVLADALSLASEDNPDLMIDMATLTGAARVALGTDLPALFTNDDDIAHQLTTQGVAEDDPLWRLPLWAPYEKMIEGKIADLSNAPEGGYGGAITAALFLQTFVGDDIPWAHIDLMAWNMTSRPGRPEGGEALSIRALFALIKERFG